MFFARVFDCHVHSEFSADGQSSLQEMCENAVRAGAGGIAFTDHIDTEKQEILNSADARREYTAAVSRLKQHYGKSLTILCGYELSAPHKNHQLVLDLERSAFDYHMVSVHHGDVDIPLSDEKEYVAGYLQEVMRALEAGNFDALGHIDLLRRFYGRFAFQTEQLEKIYAIMLQKHMALEVNTHSLKKISSVTKEDMEYVALWKDCGGKAIVLGSDAHELGKLGERFDDIVPLLPSGLEIGHYCNRVFITDYVV